MVAVPHLNNANDYPRTGNEFRHALDTITYKTDAHKPNEETIHALVTYVDTFTERARKNAGKSDAQRATVELYIARMLRGNWDRIKRVANPEYNIKADWKWIHEKARIQRLL